MKKSLYLVILVGIVFTITGCGETFHGIFKDIDRIGSGAHQIISRDGS